MGGNDPIGNGTLFPFVIDGVESSENNIEDDYDLKEKITGLYAMASVDLGQKLTVMAGVRVEYTDVDILANQWTRFDDAEDAIGSPCDTYDPDAGSSFCQETTNSVFDYDDIFPNVQAMYRFSDQLQLRAAFTTATGRPNFENAAPITRMETEFDDLRDPGDDQPVSTLESRARIRNPNLKPYYSYNYDLSLEYYTDWGAAFSIAGFHKEVEDPIFSFATDDRSGRDFDYDDYNADPNYQYVTVADAKAIIEAECNCTVNTSFLQADDAVLRLRMEGWDNAQHGRVSGVEISVSLPFVFLPDALQGFGFEGNVSLIDSEFDIEERAGLDEETPFFQQPSTIANGSLYYQKGPLQARLSVRYQDESFDEVDDPSDNFHDRYDAPREQWDAQASYRINDNWTAYVNIQNLTDERDIRWHGRDERRPNTIQQFGTTTRFGVRWNY